MANNNTFNKLPRRVQDYIETWKKENKIEYEKLYEDKRLSELSYFELKNLYIKIINLDTLILNKIVC